jgi:hypothetical protein
MLINVKFRMKFDVNNKFEIKFNMNVKFLMKFGMYVKSEKEFNMYVKSELKLSMNVKFEMKFCVNLKAKTKLGMYDDAEGLLHIKILIREKNQRHILDNTCTSERFVRKIVYGNNSEHSKYFFIVESTEVILSVSLAFLRLY